LGHKVVAKVASEMVEDGELFWSANRDSLSAFSNTPDTLWKKGAGSGDEQPTHWFHVDAYTRLGSPLSTLFESYENVVDKYSVASVRENGTGIWRVEQFYKESERKLRSGNFMLALQWAGAMAHYVGDLSQPLHVTHNYDGQLTGQPGIHGWFETKNLEKDGKDVEALVRRKARALLDSPEFRTGFDGSLMRAVLLGTERSASHVDEVLDVDARLGRGAEASRLQFELAVDRLADGAATYALILSRLWRDGGQPDAARKLSPSQPAWLAPAYSSEEEAESAGGRGDGFTDRGEFPESGLN
jgi:hypothetical protein